MGYKKIKKISKTDISYLAGFIDGEGTITLSRRHKNQNRYLAVTISNNEKNILEWVKKTLGLGTISNKKVYKENHSKSYVYAIYSRQALSLLLKITPYLKGYKKKRARLALDQYLATTPRNGKYTAKLKTKRKKFEEKFFSINP